MKKQSIQHQVELVHPIGDEAFSYSKTLRWMLSGSNRRGLMKTAAVFAVLFCAICLANYLDGSLVIEHDIPGGGGNYGFLQDFPNYLYFLVFILTPYFYKVIVETYIKTFYPDKQPKGSKEVPTSDTILQSVRLDNQYEVEYYELLNVWWNRITLKDSGYRMWYRRLRTIFIGGVVVFTGVIPLLTAESSGSWNFSIYKYPLGFVSNQVKEIFKLGFVLPPILFGVILITTATTKICRNIAKNKRFHIHPLAPDKCGGLHQLGKLSLRLFYIVVIQSLYLSGMSLVLGMPPAYVLIYPLYLGLTVFVFFYPMMSVRSSMKESKQKELNRLSFIFTNTYDRFQGEEGKKLRSEKLKKYDEQLNTLRFLYKEVEMMPVWPFNIQTLVRFSTVFLLPLGAFILQLLVNSDSILYNTEKLKRVILYFSH